MAATAQPVCPVIGTTTTVLPPNHPSYDANDLEARCPVTNASVQSHGKDIIHEHPSDGDIEGDVATVMNAQSCPAVKNIVKDNNSIAKKVCPVVGPVADVLPPSHPSISNLGDKEVCPVTKATIGHHNSGEVLQHPPVAQPDAKKCPVASGLINA